MKKIFTLFFCVLAMSFAASASDIPAADQCIDVLLGKVQPTMIMATNLDANHDGVIDIHDVTTLIDQALKEEANRAPAQEIDVNALMQETLSTETGEPNIEDVTNAVQHNINVKKQ